MKKFEIPLFYNSSIIEEIRKVREINDPRKKDLSPSIINTKKIDFYIGRHFGFCYGVKNAIEICYKTLENYPDKKIFLLSQMIHNQIINQDLKENGISFIMDTHGMQLIDWSEISSEDIVIIPAFGTSLEVLEILNKKNINTAKFNTTCPFVSKVWNRLTQISQNGFTVVIYGAAQHEETRSTFSRAKKHGPAIIVENIKEAEILCDFITSRKNEKSIKNIFKKKCSQKFNFNKDLEKIGVVNQTTMLASDTKKIINLFTETYKKKHPNQETNNYVANTKDTLCYATNENQESTLNLLKANVDAAIVVGGYNSSNTNHLVELCSKKTKTFFINSADKIFANNSILHFDINIKKEIITKNFLPKKKCKLILTSGASCPDMLLEDIMLKLSNLKRESLESKKVLDAFKAKYSV